MVYVKSRTRPRKWDAKNPLRFSIGLGNLIPDLVLTKKKLSSKFCRSNRLLSENKRKWEWTTRVYQRTKKNCGMWGWRWYQLYVVHLEWSPKNWNTNQNCLKNWVHSNYIIVEICQNTVKSPEDPKRLVVPQTPVKNQQ